MISAIIWITGVIITIIAAIEIWKVPGDTIKKIICIAIMFITNWFGLAFYYFYAKERIAEWVK